MARRGARRCAAAALLLAVLAAALRGGAAFKDAEMKKCSDLYFCRTNRARTPGQETYSIQGAVSREGGGVAAQIVHGRSKSAFDLSLTALANGAVRLRVTEPGKSRYSPPDVLLPEAEAARVAWKDVATPDKKTLLLTPPSGDVTYRLSLDPLKLEMLAAGKPVLTVNARQLLHIEPLGPKMLMQPESAWEEKFNSHTDSKPKGPQSLSVDLRFHGASHAYGIPEHASPHALPPTRGADGTPLSDPYRLYALDVYEYLADSPFGLYGAIPFLLAHAPGDAKKVPPRTVGAFWLNSAEQFVDITAVPAKEAGGGTDAHWWAESGLVDLFLLPGPRAADVWRSYAALTGAPAMPPRFALGYHQCRWNYRDEADVEAVDAGFDSHDIPYDVIWLDIEHTDGKRYMTWDARAFPTPARLQELVASHGGRKTVTIIDPHVKRDPGFAMHAEATALGLYVKTAAGDADFEGWCWPGSSSYLDVMNATVRDWWASQFAFDKYGGSTAHLHVWNDMNEPSVFNGPEVTMQKDLRHAGGAEHRDVHNAFGMFYHAATHAGLAQRSPEQRPFVLSRAFFAGSQRYGAVWTGDNAAAWEHLAVSVPMVLAIGAAGLPFVGADVGGFFGNPSAELAVRWYQLGTYYPFFRGHAHHETQRREPWLFGEPHTTAIRAAIRERYALLPYIYSLFAASAGYGVRGVAAAWPDAGTAAASDADATWAAVGTPVARPLWAEFPADAAAVAVDKAMMLGPHLLVCPALAEGVADVACYLPGGAAQRWYDGASGTESPGGRSVTAVAPLAGPAPTFLRGGGVLPRRERARRASAAQAGDPYTLLVALDAAGAAQGELYLDQGESTEYATGAFSRRRLSFAAGALRNAGVGAQRYACADAIERIVVLGLAGGPARWRASLEGGAQLDAAPGPVSTTAPGAAAHANALVVRAPPVRAGDDWTITFTRV